MVLVRALARRVRVTMDEMMAMDTIMAEAWIENMTTLDGGVLALGKALGG